MVIVIYSSCFAPTKQCLHKDQDSIILEILVILHTLGVAWYIRIELITIKIIQKWRWWNVRHLLTRSLSVSNLYIVGTSVYTTCQFYFWRQMNKAKIQFKRCSSLSSPVQRLCWNPASGTRWIRYHVVIVSSREPRTETIQCWGLR